MRDWFPDLVPSRRGQPQIKLLRGPAGVLIVPHHYDVSLYLFLNLITGSKQNCTAFELCVSCSHIIIPQSTLKNDCFPAFSQGSVAACQRMPRCTPTNQEPPTTDPCGSAKNVENTCAL